MTDSKQKWVDFTQSEIKAITSLLSEHGVTLDKQQPHISGERFLMSGKKVVLVAHHESTGEKMIIKSSADPESIREIEEERQARITLDKLPFAYYPLLAPKELWYEKNQGRLTVATEFIDQPKPYLALPLIEQFDLAVTAFKMLAGVHAATAVHKKQIGNVLGVWQAKDYIESAKEFSTEISAFNKTNSLLATLEKSLTELSSQTEEIERYCDFLTHDDFALHNFRFHDGAIYLIDQSSLRFGNKHESWARFLNYMLLYNRDLEKALTKHVHDNAAPEEALSLRLMRIYKVIELLHYHNRATQQSEGSIKRLSQRRVVFWHYVLESLLDQQPISETEIQKYQQDRDALRSKEEVARQRSLQQLV